MGKRSYLRGEKTIELKTEIDGKEVTRRFVIQKKISEGGSSVCYAACHGESTIGVLKEFYPRGYALKRDGAGQLIYDGKPEELNSFWGAREEYLETYEKLRPLRKDGEKAKKLSFLPTVEILRSCVKEGQEGTAYIWTEEPERKTFAEICRENWANASKEPEYRLSFTLYAVKALTECVSALHEEGFFHRDIKPANFGFHTRGEQPQYQNLSIFDISSLANVETRELQIPVGTEGYLEPEAGRGGYRVSNRTDIYAIGATLFHALAIPGEKGAGRTEGYPYPPASWEKMAELVKSSRLLRASKYSSNPELLGHLTTVLTKCLCGRKERYEGCEDLLKELNEALKYVPPPDFLKNLKGNAKPVLTGLNRGVKQAEKKKKKDPLPAFLYHLYRTPLYQCLPKLEAQAENEPQTAEKKSKGQRKRERRELEEQSILRVLLLGFGSDGQKFLDACLQVGQLPDRKLEVTVLADRLEKEEQKYLRERPGLPQFFQVTKRDGSVVEETAEKDIYGAVTFTERELGNLPDVLENMDKRPHYIFVALGRDDRNLSAAAACREALEVLDQDCVVSFVWKGEDLPGEEQIKGVYPVYVNRDIEKDPLYAEIERMAFNVHLTWKKDLNVDYDKVREEFRKPSNHASCVGNVISMKYKLYSMGIGMEDPEEAAKLFSERVGEYRDKLIWIEHRRWVTDQLCRGWKNKPLDASCLEENGRKNDREKTHICILRSRPDQMLREDQNYWEEEDSAKLDELDELDRLSVDLHQMFKEKAEEIKIDNHDLREKSLDEFRDMLAEKDRRAWVAFREWYACMYDIWEGDRLYTEQEIADVKSRLDRMRKKTCLYTGLKAAFLNAAGRKKKIVERAKDLHEVFYPVLASMEYQDWKQNDTVLVDRIPFILTYSTNTALMIPYKTGSNSEVFQNVAALSVIDPARVLYVYELKGRFAVPALQKSLAQVMGYLRHKNLHSAVELVLVYPKGKKSQRDQLENWLSTEERKGWEIKLTPLELENWDQLPDLVQKLLKPRGRTKFILERNDTAVGERLKNCLDWYSFDPWEMKFSEDSTCEMVRSLDPKACYITVGDMIAFGQGSSVEQSLPDFDAEYKGLWDIYTKNIPAWKSLGKALQGHRDYDAVFSLEPDAGTDTKSIYSYRRSIECAKGAERILESLKENRIIGEKSGVWARSGKLCEIKVLAGGEKEQYDRIFSSEWLKFPDDILFVSIKKNKRKVGVGVQIRGLRVEGLDLSMTNEKEPGDTPEARIDILKGLKEMNRICDLNTENKAKVSFTYASQADKELLTVTGKALEVYVYHKARAEGAFDDVVSGYKVNWEENIDVKNEFDCIITKGFRSLFIECKARKDLEPDFYFKMDALLRRFAINGTVVIVTDGGEEGEKEAAKSRGDLMGIVTISKADEIGKLDEVLLKIIDGTYHRDDQSLS